MGINIRDVAMKSCLVLLAAAGSFSRPAIAADLKPPPTPASGASEVRVGGSPSAGASGGLTLTSRNVVAATAPLNSQSASDGKWWSDVGKAAVGTFFGAVLAFLSAIYQRHLERRRARITSGNLALFRLRVLHRHTWDVLCAVRGDIASVRKLWEDAPHWAVLKPLLISPEEAAFDFDALSFLLDTDSGRQVVKLLKAAEIEYSHLRFALKTHNETAIELQEVSEPFARENPSTGWNAMAEHLGKRMVAQKVSLTYALIRAAEANPGLNRRAFAALNEELKSRFRSKVWELDLDYPDGSSRAESRLPSLPSDLEVSKQTRG